MEATDMHETEAGRTVSIVPGPPCTQTQTAGMARVTEAVSGFLTPYFVHSSFHSSKIAAECGCASQIADSNWLRR